MSQSALQYKKFCVYCNADKTRQDTQYLIKVAPLDSQHMNANKRQEYSKNIQELQRTYERLCTCVNTK